MISSFQSFSFFLGGGAHRVARGILVPRPGIEPIPPAVEARSPNHWTSREVLQSFAKWLSASSTPIEAGSPSRHRVSRAKLLSSPRKEFVCSLRIKAHVSGN